MHAFLLAGKDGSKVDEKIKQLAVSLKAKTLEFPLTKIQEVRELNSFLKLGQAERTMIVLKHVDKSTPESLNAFLKTLEEGVENVYFALTTESEYKVLPTIVSRCQVIKITNDKLQITNENTNNFLNLNTGERFKIVEKIRKREEAIEFVQNIMRELHKDLTTGNPNYGKIKGNLNTSQFALDALNQNGNVTIQLTNLIANTDN